MTSYTISARGAVDVVLGDDGQSVGKIYRERAPEADEVWVANLGSGGATHHPSHEAAYRAIVEHANAHPQHRVD